jgi:hypothetical protein
MAASTNPCDYLEARRERPAAQRGIIELLNRRVKRIHIGVSDNPCPSRL